MTNHLPWSVWGATVQQEGHRRPLLARFRHLGDAIDYYVQSAGLARGWVLKRNVHVVLSARNVRLGMTMQQLQQLARA